MQATEVTPELLHKARKGRRAAVVELLAMFYPAVHRIACSLAGREDIGRGAVKFVMKRGVGQMGLWNDEEDPRRWFHHHTVLTVRRAAKHKPDLATDPLITNAETNDAYYPAFIRALRALQHQQQEAFILHHGERLNPRQLAVAMDCSTEAAQMHLREASAALAALSGELFAAFTAQLALAHQKLTPREDLVLGDVRKRVRRSLLPRRLAGLLSTLVTLALLAGIAWFVWKIRPMLDY